MKSAEACLRSALFRFCGIGRSPNSEESHRLSSLEQCELAGIAVSLSGGLCFREFVERRKHIYYISRRKAIGFTSWSTASWQAQQFLY